MKKTTLRVLAFLSFVAFAAFDADAGLKIEHDLLVSFGVDAYGKTRLDGSFLDARVYSRVWTTEIAARFSLSASQGRGCECIGCTRRLPPVHVDPLSVEGLFSYGLTAFFAR